MPSLHPDDSPQEGLLWHPPGAIPIKFREFGKFPAIEDWWPGDLILTKSVKPDLVSRSIEAAQTRGGYSPTDASWTHAAVYLGDGLSLCEATFDSVFSGGEVRVTPVWDYCRDYVLRVRRPISVDVREKGWLIAVYSLTHVRKLYDFKYIRSIAWQAFRGRGFWDSDVRIPIKGSALVCSTLYADAYGRATGLAIGERASGLCVPAYLSQSSAFLDVSACWKRVSQPST